MHFRFCLAIALGMPVTYAHALDHVRLDYVVNVKLDLAQRKAWLKANGQEPGVEEGALSFIEGNYHIGDMTDAIRWMPATYSIRSVAVLTSPLSYVFHGQQLVRTAWGKRTRGGLQTVAYDEQRGDKPALLARADNTMRQFHFYKGNEAAGNAGFTGMATDLLSLPYASFGSRAPARLNMQVVDSHTIRPLSLLRAEPWNFTLAGQPVKAHRYVHTASDAEDTAIQVWLSDEYSVPLRYVVGPNQRYGITVEVLLTNYQNRHEPDPVKK